MSCINCLLGASGNLANEDAGELPQILPKIPAGASAEARDAIGLTRERHKVVSQEISEALCKIFMTPLEPEDVEALNAALSKISKNAERIAVVLPGVNVEAVGRQLPILGQAAARVATMMSALCKGAHGEDVENEYKRLQSLEGDADRVMNKLLGTLYRDTSDARTVMFWKDIYELLEKCIDRCRDAGCVVFHVALKHA